MISPLEIQLPNTLLMSSLNGQFNRQGSPINNNQLGQAFGQMPTQKQNFDASPAQFLPEKIAYEQCPNCNRRFFEGKLLLHLKSCKPGREIKKKTTKKPGKTIFAVESLSKTFDNERHNCEVESIPPVDTPRLPAEQEEENQFLKGGSSAVHTTHNIHSTSLTTAISQVKPGTADNQDLVRCQQCLRNFRSDRIQAHSKACMTASRQRPVFDSRGKRKNHLQEFSESTQVPATANSTNYRMSVPATKSTISPADNAITLTPQPTKPKWKINHQNFIACIRSMKEQNKEKEADFKPLENPDYIQCRWCLRRFAPNVATTHIPKCQKVLNRPKPPLEKTTLKSMTPNNSKLPKELTNTKLSSLKCLQQAQKSSYGNKLQAIGKSTCAQSAIEFQKSPVPGQSQIVQRKTHLFLKRHVPSLPTNSKIQTITAEDRNEATTFVNLVRKYEDVMTRTSKYSTIECPHCLRKFNDKAAERHIPICAQLHRFKKNTEKKAVSTVKRGNSCRIEPTIEQFCTHCGFKFSMGHKYCSNCGKKRQ